MDDVRKYSFPSLFRAKTAQGEWTTDHPTIPNEDQQKVMDDYLDRMDLGTHRNETLE